MTDSLALDQFSSQYPRTPVPLYLSNGDTPNLLHTSACTARFTQVMILRQRLSRYLRQRGMLENEVEAFAPEIEELSVLIRDCAENIRLLVDECNHEVAFVETDPLLGEDFRVCAGCGLPITHMVHVDSNEERAKEPMCSRIDRRAAVEYLTCSGPIPSRNDRSTWPVPVPRVSRKRKAEKEKELSEARAEDARRRTADVERALAELRVAEREAEARALRAARASVPPVPAPTLSKLGHVGEDRWRCLARFAVDPDLPLEDLAAGMLFALLCEFSAEVARREAGIQVGDVHAAWYGPTTIVVAAKRRLEEAWERVTGAPPTALPTPPEPGYAFEKAGGMRALMSQARRPVFNAKYEDLFPGDFPGEAAEKGSENDTRADGSISGIPATGSPFLAWSDDPTALTHLVPGPGALVPEHRAGDPCGGGISYCWVPDRGTVPVTGRDFRDARVRDAYVRFWGSSRSQSADPAYVRERSAASGG